MKQEREVTKKKKMTKTKKTKKDLLRYLLWKIALSLVRNKRDFSNRLH